MPAPKYVVLPGPPKQRARFGLAGSGHAMGVAVDRTAAATALELQPGWFSRINAATPAACGDAIDVPLIQT